TADLVYRLGDRRLGSGAGIEADRRRSAAWLRRCADGEPGGGPGRCLTVDGLTQNWHDRLGVRDSGNVYRRSAYPVCSGLRLGRGSFEARWTLAGILLDPFYADLCIALVYRSAKNERGEGIGRTAGPISRTTEPASTKTYSLPLDSDDAAVLVSDFVSGFD